MAVTKFKTAQIPVVTTVANPGLDTTVPTEQAVREAIAAIGAGAVPTFVTREVPGGVKNNSNPTFTLAHDPAGTEQVFLNGLLLTPGATEDYTIVTVTITMLVLPEADDVLLVTYHYTP